MSQKSNVPLSKVASIFNGKTPSKADQRSSGYPVLKIKDISEYRRFEGIFESFVDADFAEKFNEKKILAGDILILNAAHNADYVGTKIYKAESCVEGALATGEWMMIRTDEADLESRYAYYWFLTGQTRHEVRQLVKGIHLYPKDVARLQIPFPPLDEQRRIAAILDKADAVRRKRQKAIALTEELLRSAFLEMFGDPITNPKGWEVKPLGKVASVNRGKFTPRPRNDPRFYDGIHPFIQTGDIAAANGYLTEYHQTLNDLGAGVSRFFKPGTIVIAIVGATIGETAILSKEMYCPDSVVGIEPNNSYLCAEYVEYSLRWWKDIFRAQAPETARANINLETLRPLQIALPPSKMQKVFQEMYRRVHAEKYQEKLVLYDDLFNSLLQRAFRGEL